MLFASCLNQNRGGHHLSWEKTSKNIFLGAPRRKIQSMIESIFEFQTSEEQSERKLKHVLLLQKPKIIGAMDRNNSGNINQVSTCSLYFIAFNVDFCVCCFFYSSCISVPFEPLKHKNFTSV